MSDLKPCPSKTWNTRAEPEPKPDPAVIVEALQGLETAKEYKRGQKAIELLREWVEKRELLGTTTRRPDELPSECRQRVDAIIADLDQMYAEKAKALLEGETPD